MDGLLKRYTADSYQPEIYTWRDLLVDLADYAGNRTGGQAERRLRTATLDAYRDLCNYREWNFLIREYQFQYGASVSLTASFDFTGGSSELLVTVTDGTLPSWTEYAYAIIDSVPYQVDRQLSSSTFTLTSRTNPGQDVASGTVKLVRSAYTAPADFLKHYNPQPERRFATLTYVTPDEYNAMVRGSVQYGEPRYWTCMPSPKLYASRIIRVYPYPSELKTLSILYHATGRPLRITGFTTNDYGTYTVDIGVDANRLTLTLSSAAAITTKIRGAVIRLRSDTTTPENNDGDAPYHEQATIIDVTVGSNYAFLDRDLPTSYTSKAFVISDPVDIPQYAINALKAGSKWYYAMAASKEQKDVQMALGTYRDELTRAMESDAAYIPGSKRAVVLDGFQDDDQGSFTAYDS